MNEDFWHEKWKQKKQGFHEEEPNALLTKHFSSLDLAPGQRIFVPLCGKTNDLPWLVSQGHLVVGVELVHNAVEQFFEELGGDPQVEKSGSLKTYSLPNLEIFVGDVFDLKKEQLGVVNLVYDRAAIVALPENMRKQYATHIVNISGGADQLLISFEYDQSQLQGPPFSVPERELQSLYGSSHKLQLLEEKAVEGGLKGRCAATEQLWWLKKRI